MHPKSATVPCGTKSVYELFPPVPSFTKLLVLWFLETTPLGDPRLSPITAATHIFDTEPLKSLPENALVSRPQKIENIDALGPQTTQNSMPSSA